MRHLTKTKILGVLLLVAALATGSGVVMSQGAPESSDWETPSGWQTCPEHPCEGWVYEVSYNTATGKIEAGSARAPSKDAPPPGSGIRPQPGAAVIVLTDPNQQRLFGQLQDHYVDVETLTLKRKADTAPVPSPTTEAASFHAQVIGVLPPLALVAGLGLSVLAIAGVRRGRQT